MWNKEICKKKSRTNQLIIWINKTTFKLIFPIQSTYIGAAPRVIHNRERKKERGNRRLRERLFVCSS